MEHGGQDSIRNLVPYVNFLMAEGEERVREEIGVKRLHVPPAAPAARRSA